MIKGLFDDQASQAARTALSGLQMRQRTIANNIANVDTPHYKALKVSFEQQLAAEISSPARPSTELVRLGLTTTDTRHIPVNPQVRTSGAQPIVEISTDGTLRNDGNTVDVEREMAQLAETQIIYGAMGQVLSGKLGTLRSAINEGRR